MTIKSEYERRIDAYIDSNTGCNTGRSQRIEIEGKNADLPVYRLPIKYLAFNTENGRFVSKLETLEKEKGAKLNSWDKKDIKLIKKTLLELYPDETKELRDDLIRVGQTDPGVITSAGVVINANRRMAIFMELFEKTSSDKYNYLDVTRLPSHLNDTEIYKIEARLQYAKEYKQPYGPVNVLLKIREGINKKISPKELAVIRGVKEQDIKESLERLTYMEIYSKHVWKKIDYEKLSDESVSEHFINTQNNLKKYKDDGESASDIKKWTQLHFELIKRDYPHLSIRTLSKANEINEVKSSLFDTLKKRKEGKLTEDLFKESIDDNLEEIKDVKRGERRVKRTKQALITIKKLHDADLENIPGVRKGIKAIKKIVSEGEDISEQTARALSVIKKIYDKKLEITPEIKRNLKEISKIINKILK